MENFQVIKPSLLLTPYVKQYWFLSVSNIGQGAQRMMPSGNMTLVFNKGNTIYSSCEETMPPGGYLGGQSTIYKNTYFDYLNLIIVVFNPIGAKAFFDMPMNEVLEKNIELSLLSDPLLNELERRLLNTEDNHRCVQLIEQFLLKRISQFKTYNYKRLISVMKSICHGENDISKLAQNACLGYKQFKRIFAEYTGLNPKQFIQIHRFSQALHALQTQPALTLNDLAYKCGYYDKSHLIKDIKTFSGYTPNQFLSNSDPYSDYKSLFQSFFVDVGN